MRRALTIAPAALCVIAAAACGDRAVFHDVVDARAAFMLHALATGAAPPSLEPLLARRTVTLSLRFDRVLGDADRAAVGRTGVRFNTRDGRPVRVGTVYSAEVEWDALAALSSIPGLVRAEPAWHPVVVRPLDISIPEIGADKAWGIAGPQGARLDGTGVLIADIDTGVEYLHPAFFFDDGGAFDWIDVDKDGKFTPGVDAVDLNHNGKADPGETLNFIDTLTQGVMGTTPQNGVFDAAVDWLYNDANGNGVRDKGAPDFGETSPSLGEPIFTVRDTNRNGRLDPGEQIVMLGTGKVRAVWDSGSVYRRGQDLLQAPLDTVGHGTGAAATAMGGQIGRRYVGVAPGAELLAISSYVANFNYLDAYNFAKSEGANVILHEYSGWTASHMDGTSNEETAIDALMDEGIISAIPAGNLTGAQKHATLVLNPGKPDVLHIGNVNSYQYQYGILSIHFLKGVPGDIVIRVNQVPLPVDGTEITIGADTGYATGDTSPAGTYRVDAYFYNKQGAQIGKTFDVEITARGNAQVTVHAFCTDELSGWDKGFSFTNFDEHYTVTWPSNSTKGLSVASYQTRYDYNKIGDLSPFSSRGPRIDGFPNVDIAAPGGYDLITPASMTSELGNVPFGSYGWFGGTSGAGPHVAGAAAIAKEAFPNATGQQVFDWITGGARIDTFTGANLPDNDWGFGKLDVPGMLAKAGYDGGAFVPDAGPDTGFPDTGVDGGIDAETDAGIDAGHADDAGHDTGVDAGHDAGHDATIDASDAADSSSVPDVETDGGVACPCSNGYSCNTDCACDPTCSVAGGDAAGGSAGAGCACASVSVE